MRISLYGGFCEKGRTCVGVEMAQSAFLLDVGINTSGRGADYYPLLTPAILRRQEAILLTHAHEDHVGALGWCYSNGFDGTLYMTAETRVEAPATLADYAEKEHRGCLDGARVTLLRAAEKFRVGDAVITTGRSGHVVGGVWFAVEAAGATLVYCGDVVPDSSVFQMDRLPPGDALLLDASYGDDPVPTKERAAAISRWVAEHPGHAILPTPLAGRSLELMLAIEGPLWIHASMRVSLADQIAAGEWLQPEAQTKLRRRLNDICDWTEREALPPGPLLCHDGMGMAGPSAGLLSRAGDERLPVLLTGHLPTGSPGDTLFRRGAADWVRMPTHPTRPANVALAKACGPRVALGHSCDVDCLKSLAPHFGGVLKIRRSGECFEI